LVSNTRQHDLVSRNLLVIRHTVIWYIVTKGQGNLPLYRLGLGE
jgi:hypothetical protein